MVPSVDDIVKGLTREQVEETFYTTLARLQVDTTTWKPGAVTRAIITGFCVVAAALSQLAGKVVALGFLDLSTGAWLTFLAWWRYGVKRQPATFAETTLLVSNSSGSSIALSPYDLRVEDSAGTREFFNPYAATIPAYASSYPVTVRAVEAGSNYSAPANSITSLVTAYPTLTVNNPDAAIGSDEMDDESLRQLCRESLGALSPNGPADAYVYFAKTATRANGTYIGVSRVRVLPAIGDNTVQMVVFGANAPISGSTGDTSTDLGRVYQFVNKNATPLGVTLTISSATPYVVNLSGTVWIRASAGLTDDQVRALVNAKLAKWVSTRAIGGDVDSDTSTSGYLDHETIRGVMQSGHEDIYKTALTAPSSTVTLTATQVPVLGVVSINVVQVNRDA